MINTTEFDHVNKATVLDWPDGEFWKGGIWQEGKRVFLVVSKGW